MEILIWVILAIVILIGVFGFFAVSKIEKNVRENLDRENLEKTASLNMMKTDLIELNKTLLSMTEKFGENFTNLNEKVSEKLERNNLQIQNSVQKQLSESTKIVDEVSKRLTKLDETNKRVVDVASELKTLQNVLQNPKQRGVFGEFYLRQVLENILPPNAFSLQYKFENGEIVDAAIFLDKNKILPVDSKFSLENYNRMLEADGEERKALEKKVRDDLKKRIDETSKYIRPSENTMDFAFMFIPSESLYYDMLVGKVGAGGSERDLIEYAFGDKRVIVVSPTSFMAYLQTVLQGLKSLQIEEQSKEIQKRVGQLSVHIQKYEDLMAKLGKSLGTTVGHYNNAHRELGKIDKDVVRIAGESSASGVDPQQIDKPQAE
jgi:DNA recombination protein RmuC